MGEFTIKKWACDRCGAVQDKRPSVLPVCRMSAEYDWREGPGARLNWKELCQPCNDMVHSLLDKLIKEKP